MAYFIIPLYIGKEDMELYDQGAVTVLLKTEFKKLVKIVDRLRKIDSIIKEDNILGNVIFESDVFAVEKFQQMIDKRIWDNEDKFWNKMKELEEFIKTY
jgi:hypothetical protein